MNIRWNNVLVALLLVTALVLGIHFWEPISQFLGSMRGINGPRGDDRVIGMVALGIVAAITLAVLKILINNNRNNNP